MRRQRAVAALLLLLAAAAAAEATWTPLAIFAPLKGGKKEASSVSGGDDTCSSSSLYTKPSIAKIQVCSRSVAVSQNGAGTVITSSSSSFKLPKIASTACAEAVTKGVKDVCTGGDPVGTITSMASTCASAIAELQASSISGAEVKAAVDYPPANFTKTAYATACASGCANGQAAAEAVAQATACAVSQQTHGCNAVKTVLNGQGYSSAFVSTTAKAWSNACALGYGKAQGEGEALAKTLVTVLSRAFADVVASACSDCDACKCKPLSDLGIGSYDKLKGASDTSAAAADGRFTMARAFSRAAASYCASDKSPKALRTSVDTTISTLATMIADVYAKTTGGSSASGSAMACSGGSVSTQLQMSKQSIITALADANSVVFEQKCATAYAKVDGMVNMLKDSLEDTFDSISNACANGLKGPPTVNAADEIKKQLDANDPITAALGMAIQDAANCGCQPGVCIWCVPQRESNATLAYDMGQGPDSRGVVSGPKNVTQLLAMLGKLIN
ncbi:hypothetical protein Rsub_13244 [Raphidocelis subcapitata]|uniref:Pectinesterase inhibitor domain-containing protein n=1 Tax=Raphidocelis subcapitata TaxID=307507 RepID=A0A2V0PR18_9CHLO|nr:hypothetical protein Rsub_13244 [Raphidocelis subcapitata]|eukprot:GBG00541.1 hypothetical protein Rsub_13244 [Raphidocelis subcapitata]